MANNFGTLSSGSSRAATSNYTKSSFSATSTVNGNKSQNGISFNSIGSIPQMPASVTSASASAGSMKRHRSATPETFTEESEESKRRKAQDQTNANRGRNDGGSDEDEDVEPKTYVNPHQNVLDLPHAFYVDQAIMTEEDRLVVIRFGDHKDPDCQRQDEVLEKCAKMTHQWCVFYKCDNRRSKVPDFNQMYEL